MPPLSGTAAITGVVPQGAVTGGPGDAPSAGVALRPDVRNTLWAATVVILLMIVATLGMIRKDP